jgi:hypothetical protein
MPTSRVFSRILPRAAQLSVLVAAASVWNGCSAGTSSAGATQGAGVGDDAGTSAPGSDDAGPNGASSGSSSGGGASGSGGSSGSSSGSSGGSSSGTNGSSSGSSSGGGSSGSAGSSGSGGGSSSGGSSGSSSDGGSVWSPTSAQPIHFHWQLSDSFSAADLLASQSGQVVYDIDGQSATAADVATIHGAGAIAVCYVDVGTLEQGRPDYSDFPASVVGPGVQGWPGENWLLVTAANQSTILPLMKARFDSWCQAKGFDAIEPDNLDAFTNISGLTEADNLTYDLAIASLAHALPLSIGLKNLLPDVDASYIPQILSSFDWALVEQCGQYTECDVYSQSGSFLPLGKAVWDVEYDVAPSCTSMDAAHMNAQRRDLNLVAPGSSGYTYSPCVADTQSAWP